MAMTTTRSEHSVGDAVLYVAFELGKKDWKLAVTSGFGVAPWVRTVEAGDLTAVTRVLDQARARLGVPAPARVVSCYEAGRDGFWIHRALTTLGLVNRVVDSSSIEVNRRARRTKTDRIDAIKLVVMLVRVCAGDRHTWREVRVPAEAAEAARHGSRERTALTKERTRLRNQIDSWLATWGCVVSQRGRQAEGWWSTARDWQNAVLPAAVQARIARATARLALLAEQLAALDAHQAATIAAAAPMTAAARLVQLKGVATTSATVLLEEGLEWRAFRNRREVGGLLGYAPTHYNSGAATRDQGISRAGNAPLQAISLQLAWNWVRWQPASAITLWYRARFGDGRRARRIGIVAVARKVLIALWRYVTTGVMPTGAILKPALVG
jgi:transposase